MHEVKQLHDEIINSILISPFLKKDALSSSGRTPQEKIDESISLSKALAGVSIIHSQLVPLSDIKPMTYIGSGIIEELEAIKDEHDVKLLIIDCIISPVQQRNLEKELDLKVLDRTALIIEIFGQRARSKAGKLQVELASLTYQRTRLVRAWSHLERQRGGQSFIGGPGESQIELDRRLIDQDIKQLKKALQKVQQTRQLHRKRRKKAPIPTVALVGYTNAGKSTLFNNLTRAGAYADNLLFATLDSQMRRIKTPNGNELILSDTVGFISDLPHELIESFHSTLEEVEEADILLHIVDVSHHESQQQYKDVLETLHALMEAEEINEKTITVYNKIDKLSPDEIIEHKNFMDLNENKRSVSISSLESTNINDLFNAIDTLLEQNHIAISIDIPYPEQGQVIAWLHRFATITDSENFDDYSCFTVNISNDNLNKFHKHHPHLETTFI